MDSASNRSISLQVTNTTSQSFVITYADLMVVNCQWIAGQQPKVGETLAAGGSTTWGIVSTDANSTVEAQVLLKGSQGAAIGFNFKNLSSGIVLVEAQLAIGINYSLQPTSTGAQAACKAIISSAG